MSDAYVSQTKDYTNESLNYTPEGLPNMGVLRATRGYVRLMDFMSHIDNNHPFGSRTVSNLRANSIFPEINQRGLLTVDGLNYPKLFETSLPSMIDLGEEGFGYLSFKGVDYDLRRFLQHRPETAQQEDEHEVILSVFKIMLAEAYLTYHGGNEELTNKELHQLGDELFTSFGGENPGLYLDKPAEGSAKMVYPRGLAKLFGSGEDRIPLSAFGVTGRRSYGKLEINVRNDFNPPKDVLSIPSLMRINDGKEALEAAGDPSNRFVADCQRIAADIFQVMSELGITEEQELTPEAVLRLISRAWVGEAIKRPVFFRNEWLEKIEAAHVVHDNNSVAPGEEAGDTTCADAVLKEVIVIALLSNHLKELCPKTQIEYDRESVEKVSTILRDMQAIISRQLRSEIELIEGKVTERLGIDIDTITVALALLDSGEQDILRQSLYDDDLYLHKFSSDRLYLEKHKNLMLRNLMGIAVVSENDELRRLMGIDPSDFTTTEEWLQATFTDIETESLIEWVGRFIPDQAIRVNITYQNIKYMSEAIALYLISHDCIASIYPICIGNEEEGITSILRSIKPNTVSSPFMNAYEELERRILTTSDFHGMTSLKEFILKAHQLDMVIGVFNKSGNHRISEVAKQYFTLEKVGHLLKVLGRERQSTQFIDMLSDYFFHLYGPYTSSLMIKPGEIFDRTVQDEHSLATYRAQVIFSEAIQACLELGLIEDTSPFSTEVKDTPWSEKTVLVDRRTAELSGYRSLIEQLLKNVTGTYGKLEHRHRSYELAADMCYAFIGGQGQLQLPVYSRGAMARAISEGNKFPVTVKGSASSGGIPLIDLYYGGGIPVNSEYPLNSRAQAEYYLMMNTGLKGCERGKLFMTAQGYRNLTEGTPALLLRSLAINAPYDFELENIEKLGLNTQALEIFYILILLNGGIVISEKCLEAGIHTLLLEVPGEQVSLKGLMPAQLILPNLIKGIKTPDTVANDWVIPEKRVQTLIGSGGAGKTTLMTSLALNAQLMSLGLPITAEAGEMPQYDLILLSLNDDGSTFTGSRFANLSLRIADIIGHVLEQKKLYPSSRILVLFDELFRGTDDTNAVALIWPVLEFLNDIDGVDIIPATHYMLLKDLQEAGHISFIDFISMNPDSHKLEEGHSRSHVESVLHKIGYTDDFISAVEAIRLGNSPAELKLQDALVREPDMFEGEVGIINRPILQTCFELGLIKLDNNVYRLGEGWSDMRLSPLPRYERDYRGQQVIDFLRWFILEGQDIGERRFNRKLRRDTLNLFSDREQYVLEAYGVNWPRIFNARDYDSAVSILTLLEKIDSEKLNPANLPPFLTEKRTDLAKLMISNLLRSFDNYDRGANPNECKTIFERYGAEGGVDKRSLTVIAGILENPLEYLPEVDAKLILSACESYPRVSRPRNMLEFAAESDTESPVKSYISRLEEIIPNQTAVILRESSDGSDFISKAREALATSDSNIGRYILIESIEAMIKGIPASIWRQVKDGDYSGVDSTNGEMLDELSNHYVKFVFNMNLMKYLQTSGYEYLPVKLGDSIDLPSAAFPMGKFYAQETVHNNIQLDSGALGIFTGDNNAGKTMTGKAVTYNLLMGNCAGVVIGGGVCPELDIISSLFDVRSGPKESSSMNETRKLGHILKNILSGGVEGSRIFVAIDELGATVASDEGSALAAAVLHVLQKYGITTVTTTHYHQLEHMLLDHFPETRVHNYGFVFDEESPASQYKAQEGLAAGTSRGVERAIDFIHRKYQGPNKDTVLKIFAEAHERRKAVAELVKSGNGKPQV